MSGQVAESSNAPPSVRHWLRDPLLWLLTALTIAVHVRLLFTQGPNYSVHWIYLDEGYRLYPSVRLLHGQSLFQDMFTPYTPLSYYLHAGAYALLGVKASSVRILLIIAQTVTTITTYAIARHIMPRFFSLAAALLTIEYGIVKLNMGYPAWYVLSFTMIAILLLCRWVMTGSRSRGYLVGVGLFVGLAIATKLRDGAWVGIGCLAAIVATRVLQDFVPGRGKPAAFNPVYVAYFLLPSVACALIGENLNMGRLSLFVIPSSTLCVALLARQLFFTQSIRHRPIGLSTDILLFGAAAAAVNLPWILYYCWAVGVGPVWEQVVTIPMGMKDRMHVWVLGAFPTTRWAVRGGIAAAASVIAFSVAPPRWRHRLAPLLALILLGSVVTSWWWPGTWTYQLWRLSGFVLLPLTTGVALLYAIRHWRAPGIRVQLVVILALLNTAVSQTLYPFTGFNHWLWASIPALILACFTVSRLHAALAGHMFPTRWLAVIAQCAVLAFCGGPVVAAVKGAESVPMLRNAAAADMPIGARLAATQIQRVVDFVREEVPENEPVLEIPGSLYVFFAERQQAARLDYFYILDADLWDEERELEVIRQANPSYALIREYAGPWRKKFPRVSSYVNHNYVLERRIGVVSVLKKRNAELD